MTTVATIALLGFLGVLGLVVAVLMAKAMFPPQEDSLFPDGDPHALDYCDGCGCRHRRSNMEWTPTWAYRCRACCDKVFK
jgi:hypothetical protein